MPGRIAVADRRRRESGDGGTPGGSASRKTRTRSGTLEPGLIPVRTYRSTYSTGPPRPSPSSRPPRSTSRVLDAVQNVVSRGFSPDYYLPMAAGYLVLDQPATVEFELQNLRLA